jgi:chromosome partitioning protein
MKVLTIATLKGGNGKTTTSLAVAAVLAEKGLSVVLVDSDPQSTATMIFGMKPVAEPWTAEPVELYLKPLEAGSITLVRGGRPLRLATEQQRDAFFDRSDIQADIMIIDTAPGEIELVDSALQYSDLVLIPVEPSPLSLTGMTDVAQLAKRLQPPPPIRTVLTRVHKVRNATRELAERVERLLPGSLCRAMIPEDARVVDSPDFGLPVTLSDRHCRASEAYRELVEELYPALLVPDPADVVPITRAGGAHGG